MLYLRTGANGSCKTLFTLDDVRKLQLETGRPVAINRRFKMNEEKRIEFGWAVIDFEDWQAEPDGTIFLIDECHNDMPVRASSAPVPEPIKMLAEHRARGFDFFLLTQHPMNIDPFVRKLIGAPGWHQHLKRVFGGTSMTRVLQWDAVNAQCEKDGSGKSAQITTRAQPKHVYEWYDSASLHTAKVRVPRAFWVILGALVLVPLLFWTGFRVMHKFGSQPPIPGVVAAGPVGQPGQPGQPQQGSKKEVLSTPDYLASFTPRVSNMPHTASRYDEVTKPVTAPYPAACVQMGDRCKCFSQQATPLPIDPHTCYQIVQGGYFLDWDPGQKQSGGASAAANVPPAQPMPPQPRQTGLQAVATFDQGGTLPAYTNDPPKPPQDFSALESMQRRRVVNQHFALLPS